MGFLMWYLMGLVGSAIALKGTSIAVPTIPVGTVGYILGLVMALLGPLNLIAGLLSYWVDTSDHKKGG